MPFRNLFEIPMPTLLLVCCCFFKLGLKNENTVFTLGRFLTCDVFKGIEKNSVDLSIIGRELAEPAGQEETQQDTVPLDHHWFPMHPLVQP